MLAHQFCVWLNRKHSFAAKPFQRREFLFLSNVGGDGSDTYQARINKRKTYQSRPLCCAFDRPPAALCTPGGAPTEMAWNEMFLNMHSAGNLKLEFKLGNLLPSILAKAFY